MNERKRKGYRIIGILWLCVGAIWLVPIFAGADGMVGYLAASLMSVIAGVFTLARAGSRQDPPSG